MIRACRHPVPLVALKVGKTVELVVQAPRVHGLVVRRPQAQRAVQLGDEQDFHALAGAHRYPELRLRTRDGGGVGGRLRPGEPSDSERG